MEQITEKAKIVIDVFDHVNACISVTAANESQLVRPVNLLYVSLSFFEEDYKYSWEYQNGHSDGRRHLFNKKNKSFPIGLVPRVFRILRENLASQGYTITLSPQIWAAFSPPTGKVSEDQFKEYFSTLNIFNAAENMKIEPRDYQTRLVMEAINGRRASLMACTGAGKSLSLYLITRWVLEKEDRDILIIVPSAGLVNQLYSDFKNDYGWKEIETWVSPVHSQIKEGKLTPSQKEELIRLGISEDAHLKRVVIVTWQSLQYKSPDFFKRFGAVLVDEAHGSKADVLQDILQKCKNAHIKVGVSGTLTDDGIASALVEGALGQKKVIIRSKELIDRGVLTRTEINTILIPYDDESKKLVHRQDFDGEVALLSYNGSKRDTVKSLIDANQIRTNENTVILFKLTDTLFSMYDYFKENYPQFKCITYYGDIKASDRENIRGQLEKEGGYLVFATYGTMKQGINIKRLHNVIFAECSKSLTMVVQSIGRILRIHADKIVARVFDLVDDCSYFTRPRKGGFPKQKLNYAMQHYEKRKSFYRDEEFPITEYIAPFLATANVDQAEQARQISKDNKASKSTKKKKATPKRVAGDVSKFFDA